MTDDITNPSYTWSRDAEKEAEAACADTWGMSTIKGGGWGPVPYRAETPIGEYIITDQDQNYLIEFKGETMTNVRIKMDEKIYPLQETVLVSSSSFTLLVDDGLVMNNISGGSEWSIGSLGDGAMIKAIGPYTWLMMGDVVRVL